MKRLFHHETVNYGDSAVDSVVVPFDFHGVWVCFQMRWTWDMPKRAIRIVKHIGQVPCMAVCTFCNQQFSAPISTLPKVKEATADLQKQFDRHKCKLVDSSQNALRIVREATESE